METLELLRAVVTLGFVLGLIYVCGHAAKRLKPGLLCAPSKASRLSVIETKPLDQRRKLVLVTCDATQYLILLGVQSETVLDSDKAPDDGADALNPGRPADRPVARLEVISTQPPLDGARLGRWKRGSGPEQAGAA